MSSPYIHLNQIRGVICDWDGVIAETKLDFTPVMKKYFGGRRVPLLEAAAGMREPLKTELMTDIKNEEIRGASLSHAVSGAFEFISLLNRRRIPWCILSRNCRESIERAAHVIGFALPPQTFGREARHVKPDPRSMTDAATSIGVPPSQCLAIGDYIFEMIAARRAGMRCVLVNSPNQRCAALADAVFPTLHGLAAGIDGAQTLVPWEYQPFVRDAGRQALEKMHRQAVHLDIPLSSRSLALLGDLAAAGIGGITASAGRALSHEELRETPLISPVWLEAPLEQALAPLFSARYPLLRIAAGESGRPLSSIASAAQFSEEIKSAKPDF